MILESGADDLFAVIKIFGADEADHGVDEQRGEVACDSIGTDFARLLVDAVVRAGGERGALAGLELHDVVADGSPAEGEGGIARLREQGQVDAEAFVSGLGAGDGLKNEIDGRAVF